MVSSCWPGASVPARWPATAPPGRPHSPAHRGAGRSGPDGYLKRSARPARARSPPLPGSTRRRRGADQRARDALSGTRRASQGVDQARDGCGCYSGYSEDAAIDNVSSPKPRTRGVYREDTQTRAMDNGGHAGWSQSLCVSDVGPNGPRGFRTLPSGTRTRHALGGEPGCLTRSGAVRQMTAHLTHHAEKPEHLAGGRTLGCLGCADLPCRPWRPAARHGEAATRTRAISSFLGEAGWPAVLPQGWTLAGRSQAAW
jgi:hypothetical protein